MPNQPIVARFPHIIHGGDYNPEQWLSWKDTIWKEDMRLAKLAGINSLSVGIFSWAALEPAEGEYHFEWLDEVMNLLAENNMVAVLATPSGAKTAWMSQKYPEILRVNAARQRQLHGGRHNHCLTSPAYRRKVTEMNTRLAQRYKDHPALGVWHVSNEYGGECHCPLCQAEFRLYLKNKYGTLEKLNAAWWTSFWAHTYTDWEQIESPSPIGEDVLHGLKLDWKRFTTERFVDFYLHEIKPLKEYTPGVPCTANLMGTYPGIDYFRFAEVLDVASWDSYPQWTGGDDTVLGARTAFLHDLTRGLKDKPFMLMESCPSATNWRPVTKLHRPAVHKLQSLQALAHGADSVQYFQFRKSRGSCEKFHGAVVDHEGTENTRVFKDIAEVGECLKGLDGLIGADTPAKAAIIYDWNVRWALEDAKGFLQSQTGYEETVIAHHRSFWKKGIPVDVIDPTRSFDKYSVLVAPMLYLLRQGAAKKIDDFVQRGGIFIATYITGYVNETDLCYLGGFPGDGLKETLGIWNEEIDSLYPQDENAICWKGKQYRAKDFCELIHLQGAEALGSYAADFYQGRPALTVNRRGKGKAYYIAARTDDNFLDDFYAEIASEADLKPALPGSLPAGVSAQLRTKGKKEFVFIQNFTNEQKTVDSGTEGLKTLAPFESVIVKRGS
ncbi:beta-galactosidase [Spirochaetia bacterium]|nr:beta-galactosidase [Spirochaetia bacterium]